MDKNAKAKTEAVERYKAAFLAVHGKPCDLIEDYPGRFRIATTGLMSHLGYTGWRQLDEMSANLEARIR